MMNGGSVLFLQSGNTNIMMKEATQLSRVVLFLAIEPVHGILYKSLKMGYKIITPTHPGMR